MNAENGPPTYAGYAPYTPPTFPISDPDGPAATVAGNLETPYQSNNNVNNSSGSVLVPPTAPPVEYGETYIPPGRHIPPLPSITVEDARDALAAHVSQHCCYGSNALRRMEFKDIQMNCAIHYTLETFTEKRETRWKTEPYHDSVILDAAVQGPPSPWEIPVYPPSEFMKGSTKIPVPGTISVRVCPDCCGNGRVRCESCRGLGGETCYSCNGVGKRESLGADSIGNRRDNCPFCDGMGRKRCFRCQGRGQVNCRLCAGNGRVKIYVELAVTWTNHIDHFVTGYTAVPEHLIHASEGTSGLEESGPRVYPVTGFPDVTVNSRSRDLIQKRANSNPMEKILQQRHRVRLVPIANVSVAYRGTIDRFQIYGMERLVYYPNYPSKCCCGYCSIL